MSVYLCLPHPVAVSAFMICRGLCVCTEMVWMCVCTEMVWMCVCTEMVWMCVLYVSFESKLRPRTFGCVTMGSALLCILGPDCSYILQGLA